jgi:hypothetical protein
MLVYRCPCCGHRSVMWDARSGLFLCYYLPCATAFSPPEVEGGVNEELAHDLSLNRLNVTQQWFDSVPRSRCSHGGSR